MPATIRLQRVGRNKQSSFRIVVTEKTLARGGPALEVLGIYNPRTEPSTVRFDVSRALYWLRAGALPSESVESIFRKTGVMHQFRSGVEPDAVAGNTIVVGAPFGGGKTSQRGRHGGAAPIETAAAAVAPAVEETVEEAAEEPVAEAEAAAPEAQAAATETEAEEAVAEAEEAEAPVAEAEEAGTEADTAGADEAAEAEEAEEKE